MLVMNRHKEHRSFQHHIRRSRPAKAWRRFGYKHTSLAVAALFVFVIALDTSIVQALLSSIENLGIPGIILSGMLFVSFFTAAPAVVLLVELGYVYSPLEVAFYGAIGSAVGDLIILKLFEERIAHELKPLVRKWKLSPILRAIRSKRNRERATLAGMIAIASPLPDEIGIGLLGIAHLPTVSLLVVTFLLNAAGILILVLAT